MKSLNLSIYHISKEAFEEQQKAESGECGIFLLWYEIFQNYFVWVTLSLTPAKARLV